MLDLKDEGDRLRLAEAVTKLECEIELPESWSDFFNVSGMTGSSPSEKRRAPRWKNRALAGLEYRSTFPVLPRNEAWHPIYIKDLSRVGAAFVHSEQLYPLEQLQILFIDDRSAQLLQNDCLRTVEIVWCKRIQGKCFEVGCRFIE